MHKQIQGLYNSRRLIGYLSWGRIKAGEREKTFGVLWAFVNPLALLAIYYFIFNIVFDSNIENFALFLFSAIIAWRFFAQTVNLSAVSISSNSGIVKEAYFPKSVLPITIMALTAYDYFFSFLVLIVMTVAMGVALGPKILAWPLVFFVQCVFTLAISMFAAVLGVSFRDLPNVLSILLRLGFYLSGTMYAISRVPEQLRPYFELNPMHIFFESYRGILLYDRFPSLTALGIVFLCSFILLLAGLSWMDRREGSFIKHL